ncbi:MAG TPA: Sir2 family NAD-dependent protein deacetylase [Polyangiaceae bacterium]|jgi:NAD-dependent deacetylase|nr:Sir2 family NAD-dependent protein deacetylase [Polyangiaceae bacterium]
MLDDVAPDAFVVVLTGAGISAESGIPTFRGPEGYWKVGSRHYRPMELATHAAFSRMPDDVWSWYLYRRAACRAAQPNRAHEALVVLEERLGERFLLVTQNVDGLHLRAGNSPERTFQIHGNIDFMRCARDCVSDLWALPDALGVTWEKTRSLGDAERALLVCPSCGGPSRPHVLWFDEQYDEERFRFQSSLRAADRADVLVVVGTSGATNLPNQICHRAAERGATLIVIDTEPTPFSALAERGAGAFLEGTATALVPELCARLGALP